MARRLATAVLAGAVLAVSGLALAGPAPAPVPVDEANDTVHLADNSATNVVIVEDDWKGVSYKVKAENVDAMRFPASRVRGTEYGTRPAQYDTGMEALRKGEFTKAEELLRAGLAAAKDKKLHQYFLAGLIEACEGQRKLDELRNHAKKMTDAKPVPRLIYDAWLKVGESYLKEGKHGDAFRAYDEAYKFFKALEEDARKKESAALPGVSDYIKGYRVQAGYLRILSMERDAKDPKETGRAYFLFESEATGYQEVIYLCRLGRARCEAAQNKPDDAVKEVERVREELGRLKPDDRLVTTVLPAVYVAMGDVSRIKLDYRKARWYYLTVIVQYATDRESVARAHFMTGLCYEKLHEESRERDAVPRALRHYETITKEFQNSIEFAAAKERLERLKSGLGA